MYVIIENLILQKIPIFLLIFQIFDEILVNAADNKQRDKKMDTIKIDIKPEENTIRVRLYN